MLEHPRTQFLSALGRSRLVSSERLRQAQAMLANAPHLTAEDLAEWLVLVGDLTAWQAERLLEGTHVFHLDKYKLLDMLGQGGMGAVFKAEHAVMGRQVALKVLFKARLGNPTAVGRFRREIKALAALDHPNIVTAHDAGQVNETHFLVMEYVGGADLNDWLKQFGRLPIPLACEFVRQASLGLEHAWQAGLVHRDIKPANLLVSWPAPETAPVVKLLDLGLARFCDDSAEEVRSNSAADSGAPSALEGGLTQYGNIVGTPDYLSPEQIRGTRDIDIRSDIFSLGCTLFKTLTGTLPFGGRTVVEKLHLRSTAGGPPAMRLSEVLPDAPPRLEAMLAKMLARRPEERFQSPLEIASALTEFAQAGEDDWNRYARRLIGKSAPPSRPARPAGDEATEDDVRVDHDQSTHWLATLGNPPASPTATGGDGSTRRSGGSGSSPAAHAAASPSSGSGSTSGSTAGSGSGSSGETRRRTGRRKHQPLWLRRLLRLRNLLLVFLATVTVTLLLGLGLTGRLNATFARLAETLSAAWSRPPGDS